MEADAPLSSDDEGAGRAIVKRVQESWNAGDGDAFATPFQPDADYVIVNGARIKGREAIAHGHSALFATLYRDSHNVVTVQSLPLLRPDVAVAHVEWNLEYHVGDEGHHSHTINTMVLTKEGGEWRIAAFHNTPILEERRL